MARLVRTSILLLIGLVLATSAQANESFSTAPPLTRLAGVALECKDIRGSAVRVVSLADLGDVGRAGVVNRVPVIAMDQKLLNTLPEKLQLFFYAHECAHHVLGHVYLFSLSRETEADCWAIKNGRELGHFSRRDIEGFEPFLKDSGGSSWGHLPGPERVKFLLKCFDDR